jgi:colanic acid/amylovoran biosynthesis protein
VGSVRAATLGPMSRRFSVIAGTLYGNRGAQGMTETVVGHVRSQDPSAEFAVFSYYPTKDRELLTDPAVAVHSATPKALVLRLLPLSLVFGLLRLVAGRRVLRRAPADIRDLGTSTALVCVAGVAFIDGREKFLPFNVLTLLPAWLLGVPIVKMSQATGPYSGRLNRLVARVVLPRVTMVWARGARTLEHLRESGFRGVRYAQADDIAFAHRSEYALTDEGGPELEAALASVAAAAQGARSVVGVCPSSVVAVKSRASGGSYEKVLAQLVGDLARDGHQVVLFPNATRADDPVGERNNDLPVIRRVLAAAGDVQGPTPIAVDMDINASGVKRVIGACDVVLVSRFHAMVGALSLAVPVVVLGWSHKYAEVMARFGLEDKVTDYKALSREQLRSAVEDTVENRDEVAAAIRAGLPSVLEGARRPLDGLLRPDLGVSYAGD